MPQQVGGVVDTDREPSDRPSPDTDNVPEPWAFTTTNADPPGLIVPEPPETIWTAPPEETL